MARPVVLARPRFPLPLLDEEIDRDRDHRPDAGHQQREQAAERRGDQERDQALAGPSGRSRSGLRGGLMESRPPESSWLLDSAEDGAVADVRGRGRRPSGNPPWAGSWADRPERMAPGLPRLASGPARPAWPRHRRGGPSARRRARSTGRGSCISSRRRSCSRPGSGASSSPALCPRES